ncbi:hypothetical protein JS578_00920 [Dysgonomonadaceae bacterium zrk40]|nr:hypothetical protein JS578_00920 [Dysgonomonadaceae bacterium zrk40]
MNDSIIQFNNGISRIRDLNATIKQVDKLTTNLIDVSDLYRAQIVLVVSTLDHFIHSFVLEEMLEIFNARRDATNSFNEYPIPISIAQSGRPTSNTIASHIRQKHSWLTFHDPIKIADALRLISDKKVWEEVAPSFHISAGDLKIKLKLVVDRRNKIAHEADMDPSYPGRKWPIDGQMLSDTINFISELGKEIYIKIK